MIVYLSATQSSCVEFGSDYRSPITLPATGWETEEWLAVNLVSFSKLKMAVNLVSFRMKKGAVI